MSRHTNALRGEVQVLGPDSSVVPSGRIRGNEHKQKHRRLHLKMRKNFPLRVTALEQAVKRACGVSFYGNTQNLPGHDPVQPAPDEPALAENWTG